MKNRDKWQERACSKNNKVESIDIPEFELYKQTKGVRNTKVNKYNLQLQ